MAKMVKTITFPKFVPRREHHANENETSLPPLEVKLEPYPKYLTTFDICGTGITIEEAIKLFENTDVTIIAEDGKKYLKGKEIVKESEE